MVRNNSQEKLEPYNFLVRITSNKIIANKINPTTMKTQSITLVSTTHPILTPFLSSLQKTSGTNLVEAISLVATLNESISTCIPTSLWRRRSFRSLNCSMRSRWPPKYSMNSSVSSRSKRWTIENKLCRPSIRSNNKQIFYRTRMNAKNLLYIPILEELQRRVAPILAAISTKVVTSQVILTSQILLFHRQLSYNRNILSAKQNNWDKRRERYILSSIISSSMKKIACN